MTQITVCAFTDKGSNSVAYKKFFIVDEAVSFYRSMLLRKDVNVISTRKVNVSSKSSPVRKS